MKKTMKTLTTALLMALALTACDPLTASKELESERAQRTYQSAMQELSAGRVTAAIDGFKAAVRADPGNTSAHFQLACLLQDRQRNYLEAIGEYRVFLLLAPKSEKAAMAQARIARCEQLYREQLLKADSAKIAGSLKADNDRLVQSLEEVEGGAERLKAELAAVRTKLASEQRENARLRALMEAQAHDAEAPKLEVVEARDLLEEDEPLAPAPMTEAMRLAAEAEAEDVAAGAHAALLGEKRSPVGVTNTTVKASSKAAAKELPLRPDTYVIQNGDTLYKIAHRFYGKTSAWKAIREANKETISTDGRVRAGQTIKLP